MTDQMTLAKQLMVATHIMQSSSNKLSTSVSDSVKCKQKKLIYIR